MSYLIKMGMSRHAAEHIHDYLEEFGPIMQQWNVPEENIAMLRTLHNGSWFRVGDLESVVCYALGGRQGCKVGSTMFNSAYDIPLRMLRQ